MWQYIDDTGVLQNQSYSVSPEIPGMKYGQTVCAQK